MPAMIPVTATPATTAATTSSSAAPTASANPHTHHAPPATRQSARYLDSPVSFRLDPDLRLACEDQAQAAGHPFEEWLQQTINDSLRAYLGGV